MNGHIEDKTRELSNMSWTEFANYLGSKENLTNQQGYIIAGNYYNIDESVIASESNTTIQTVRSQRTQLKFDNLDQITTKEIWKTPVPNIPFRHVGQIDYFFSDSWPMKGNKGFVNVYFSVKPTDNYVAVIEETTITDESEHIESKTSTWTISEQRERTTVYKTIKDFMVECPHSPKNRNNNNDSNIEYRGILFEY